MTWGFRLGTACAFNLSSLLKQISQGKEIPLRKKISSFRRDPTSASAREFLEFLSGVK